MTSRKTKQADSVARLDSTTKQRILDAAERLFAARGMSGVSSRQIVSEAGVNLAAIHYYFGTKDAILEAVYERRARHIADERMRRLEELLASNKTPPVEEVISAFLAPSFHSTATFGSDRFLFSKLRARLIVENSELARKLQGRFFNQSSKIYLQTFQKILPEVSKVEIHWRFNFLLGAMVYVMADLRRIEELTDGAYGTSDREDAFRWMVAFFGAAFRQPPLDPMRVGAPPSDGDQPADQAPPTPKRQKSRQ